MKNKKQRNSNQKGTYSSMRTQGEWKVHLTKNSPPPNTWDIVSEETNGFTFITEVGDENFPQAKANAEYIVKVANSHEKLVAALQDAIYFIEELTGKRNTYTSVLDNPENHSNEELAKLKSLLNKLNSPE